jgi:uncharacterized membrane protein
MYRFDNEDDRKKYWDGRRNKAIRYYFYLQMGLALVNEFRYLIMSVLAIYALLKMDNPLWMPIMFFGAVPFLLLLGWISVHHMEKTMEYLRTHFATHFVKLNITLQEKQLKVLEDIKDKL